MSSRKPDLRLPLPKKDMGEALRSPASIRSPRFHENFDAPFSEALLNASMFNLATDNMNFPSTSTNGRTSYDAQGSRRSSYGPRGQSSTPPSPLRWRNPSWGSESRRSSVNDRIREWARKSWGAVRRNDADKEAWRDGYFDEAASRTQSSVVGTPSSGATTPDEFARYRRADSYPQAVVTVVEISESN